MKVSSNFLEFVKGSKAIEVHKVPRGHHTFEYSTQSFTEGVVVNTLELDSEVIGELDNKVIGYFGMDLEHRVLAYYLKT